jgi:hypothetical protein
MAPSWSYGPRSRAAFDRYYYLQRAGPLYPSTEPVRAASGSESGWVAARRAVRYAVPTRKGRQEAPQHARVARMFRGAWPCADGQTRSRSAQRGRDPGPRHSLERVLAADAAVTYGP